jgi:hypothetical protein
LSVRVSFYIKSRSKRKGPGYRVWAIDQEATLPPAFAGRLCRIAGGGYASGAWTGPGDWEKYQGVVTIGCNTEEVSFTVGLRGPGKMWVDDVTAELAEETSSGEVRRPLPGTQNLDFEQ